MDYLYPDRTSGVALDRYLGDFSRLLDVARQAGARVVVIKLPVPPAFRSQLPAEMQFDAAITRVGTQAGVPVHDFSTAVGEPRFYFDTDHLNRAGLTVFFNRHLKSVLAGGSSVPA
jgi:hypothetical protein